MQVKDLKQTAFYGPYRSVIKLERYANHSILVKKTLIDVTRNVERGYFLSQLLYWFGTSEETGEIRTKIYQNDRLWVAFSYEDWFTQTRLTKNKLRRIINSLKASGIITTDFKKFNGTPRIHISVNWDVLATKVDEVSSDTFEAANHWKNEIEESEESDETDSDETSLSTVTKRDPRQLQNVTVDSNEVLPSLKENHKETQKETYAFSQPKPKRRLTKKKGNYSDFAEEFRTGRQKFISKWEGWQAGNVLQQSNKYYNDFHEVKGVLLRTICYRHWLGQATDETISAAFRLFSDNADVSLMQFLQTALSFVAEKDLLLDYIVVKSKGSISVSEFNREKKGAKDILEKMESADLTLLDVEDAFFWLEQNQKNGWAYKTSLVSLSAALTQFVSMRYKGKSGRYEANLLGGNHLKSAVPSVKNADELSPELKERLAKVYAKHGR